MPIPTAAEHVEFVRQLNTRESPAEELFGERLLLQAKQRFNTVVERTEALGRPAEDSKLQAVDQLTPYDPLSFQVRAFMGICTDNIRTLFEYVDKVGALPMVAHYSLIRSAIEASSLGIWILSAGRKDKQAFYSLRLSFGNHDMLLKLGKAFERANANTSDTVPTRLRELQSALGHGYADRNLADGATIVSIIENADRVMQASRFFFNGEQTWRAASGAAHGNSAVLQSILERVPTDDIRDRSATVIMRSRITFTAGMTLAAVENFERLADLYESAAAIDPSLRNARTRQQV